MPLTLALCPSHLREVPRPLLQAGHLVTVEQLREAADLIVHHAASVVPGASQRAQEELPVFGVATQLGGFEGGAGEGDHTAAVRGSKNKGTATETVYWIVYQDTIDKRVVASILYLRTPTMAGVQGGRVVLLYTLIHAQVAHFRVTNLCKDKAIFGSGK